MHGMAAASVGCPFTLMPNCHVMSRAQWCAASGGTCADVLRVKGHLQVQIHPVDDTFVAQP